MLSFYRMNPKGFMIEILQVHATVLRNGRRSEDQIFP